MAAIECPKHGLGCDYNLTDHPLPSPKYQLLGPVHRPEDDDKVDADPTGYMADCESRRLYGP